MRELRNLVESLVVLAPQDEIRPEDLPDEVRAAVPEAALSADVDEGGGGGAGIAAGGPAGSAAGMTMEEIERRAILDALERTGGNRTQAAEMLGIGLRTLQRKLKDYKLAGKAAEDR